MLDLRDRDWMRNDWKTWTSEQFNEYNRIMEERMKYDETFHIGPISIDALYGESFPYFSIYWSGKPNIIEFLAIAKKYISPKAKLTKFVIGDKELSYYAWEELPTAIFMQELEKTVDIPRLKLSDIDDIFLMTHQPSEDAFLRLDEDGIATVYESGHIARVHGYQICIGCITDEMHPYILNLIQDTRNFPFDNEEVELENTIKQILNKKLPWYEGVNHG